MPSSMSTAITAQGLDVDDLAHVTVSLSNEPSEQWMEAFREHWADAGTMAGPEAKTDTFSHFSERSIVFRGIDVDGFVRYCKNLTQDAIKFANERTRRFEMEREARIRGRGETAGQEHKYVEAERAKARKVRFD